MPIIQLFPERGIRMEEVGFSSVWEHRFKQDKNTWVLPWSEVVMGVGGMRFLVNNGGLQSHHFHLFKGLEFWSFYTDVSTANHYRVWGPGYTGIIIKLYDLEDFPLTSTGQQVLKPVSSL